MSVNFEANRKTVVGCLDQMIGLSNDLGDQTTSRSLREQVLRYKTGFVRFAFIGISGSGKSTVVNGLADSLVVPENPNCSSPIPVWMGYHPGPLPEFCVYRTKGDALVEETVNTQTFMKEYCYDDVDILDNNRTRFRDVRWASVFANSDICAGGMNTIIDTLGIGVNEVDNIKTTEVLDSGIDIVVFVSSTNVVDSDEVKFIRDNILGLGDRKLHRPVPLSDFFFLHNDRKGYSILPNGYKNALRAGLFKSSKDNPNGVKPYSPEAIDEFLGSHVFFYDARDVRLAGIGAYPYRDFTPVNSEKKYDTKYLKTRELYKAEVSPVEEDEKALAQIAKMPQGMLNFKAALMEKASSMVFGNGSAISNRVGELLLESRKMSDTARKRAEAIRTKGEEARAIIAKAENLIEEFREEKSGLSKDLNHQSTQMREAVLNIGEKYMESFLGAIGASMETHLEPPADLVPFVKFRDAAGDNDRYSLIKESIEPVLQDALNAASKAYVDQLWSMEADDEATPASELEQTRRYLDSQAVRLNLHVDQLREIGAEDAGIKLPSKGTVNDICNTMTTAVSSSILAIFEGMKTPQYWKDTAQRGMNLIKTHTLPWLLGTLIGKNLPQPKFWGELLNKVVLPTALDLFVKSMQNLRTNSFPELFEAYTNAASDFQMVYNELEGAVKTAKKALAATADEAEQKAAVARNEALAQKSDKVASELNALRQSLVR